MVLYTHKANEFLDNLDNGYSELKQHEMISLPKIRLQSIMQEYATRQLDFQKGMFSPIIDYLKKQYSLKQYRRFLYCHHSILTK